MFTSNLDVVCIQASVISIDIRLKMIHRDLFLSWLILAATVGMPNIQAFGTRAVLKLGTTLQPRTSSLVSTRLHAGASYGLATPAARILKEVVSTSKGQGYYRAREDEQVMEVVTQITEGHFGDVALVYTTNSDDGHKEDSKQNQNTADALLGIFTETDYINVRFLHFGYHTNFYLFMSLGLHGSIHIHIYIIL